MVESIYLAGRCLEFERESHTYAVDGIVVPSVTTILKSRFPDTYSCVKPEVLQAAAERGTQIHAAIERFCRTGWEACLPEIDGFKDLMDRHGLRVFGNELPLILFDAGEPVAAGTADLVFEMDGCTCGADIKTTSRLYKDYLECQLNLYRLGYEQTYGSLWDKLYALHLRGDHKKLVEIPVNEELAFEIIRRYKEETC